MSIVDSEQSMEILTYIIMIIIQNHSAVFSITMRMCHHYHLNRLFGSICPGRGHNTSLGQGVLSFNGGNDVRHHVGNVPWKKMYGGIFLMRLILFAFELLS